MPCRCAQCFGFREWAIDHGVRHAGLEPAPGHAPPELRQVEKPSSSMTELNSAELAHLQHMARKRQSSFPWEDAA